MQARSQAAAAQTDVVLVPAPGAGNQIVVRHVFCSTSSAAGTHTLESGGSALRWEAYLPINGSVSDDGRELFWCAENASLTLSTTAASGARFTQVSYEVQVATGA